VSNPIRVRLRAAVPRVRVQGRKAVVVLTLAPGPITVTIVEAF
jgi:hypothetical protein